MIRKRHMGIECLRILSMFMIVILHILGQGGILSTVEMASNQYYIAWFLEITAYCSVNCYALISGYVGVNSNFRYSRIILLWLQVFFYTVIITLIFSVVYPDKITLRMYLNAFFPFTTKQYWYMTAYFGMFFLMPFMNAGINSLSERNKKLFFSTVIIFFLFLPTVLRVDTFNLGGGYSMIWLCVLYIVGGCMRKMDVSKILSQKKAGILFFSMIFITWLSKCFFDKFNIEYGMMFVNFTSPTIFLAAIALFVFFLHIQIYKVHIIKIIEAFATVSLGVYIIHVNPFIWNNFIWNFSVNYALDGSIIMVLKIIITAVFIYIGCSLIDMIRKKIFDILMISERCKMIDDKLEKKNV